MHGGTTPARMHRRVRICEGPLNQGNFTETPSSGGVPNPFRRHNGIHQKILPAVSGAPPSTVGAIVRRSSTCGTVRMSGWYKCSYTPAHWHSRGSTVFKPSAIESLLFPLQYCGR